MSLPLLGAGATKGGVTYENFTTFTEVDPNSRFAVAAHQIDVDGLTRDEDAYVYGDYGVAHFGATFMHDFDFQATPTASLYGICGVYGIGNTITHIDESGVENLAVFVEHYHERVSFLNLENDNRDAEEYSWVTGTWYYGRVLRTSETTVQLRVYTDVERTVLAYTLSQTIASGRRYRYLYGVQSYNSEQAERDIYAKVRNLNIHEP